MAIADTESRPYQPYPWPFGHPSILTPVQQPTWLDIDFPEDDDSEDYVPPDLEGSASGGSSSDSDDGMSESKSADDSTSEDNISEAEVVYITTDAQTSSWPSSPSPSLKALDEEEELTRQIGELVKAEEAAAAAYNPDEVVALITQFYELLITMGHWPEDSLCYPPHTNPPVNEKLAVQLGYTPTVISIMQRLPYLLPKYNHDDRSEVYSRTRLADYTWDEDLREGRRPHPYRYLKGCPDIDPWLLPLMLPNRYGWHVMLDTKIGVVRAYCTEGYPPQNTVEWRRHREVSRREPDRVSWTEYRRAPIVPAARYFEDLIYAYRSLSRLPVISPDRNDPKEDRYRTSYTWVADQEREMQNTLLTLYRECGWPNEWRRAEFLAKWQVEEKEIAARAHKAMTEEDSGGRHRR